jgi:hypothetical protein
MPGGAQKDPDRTSLLVARKVARRGIAGGGNNELNSVAEPEEALAPSPNAFEPLSILTISSIFFCHVRALACTADDVPARSMHKHSINNLYQTSWM